MLVLSAGNVPTTTDIAGIVGETTTHTLDDLKNKREQEVVFRLAKRLLELKFLDSGVGGEPVEEVFLFPQLLSITRRFMAERVRCKDDAFVQMLPVSYTHLDVYKRQAWQPSSPSTVPKKWWKPTSAR